MIKPCFVLLEHWIKEGTKFWKLIQKGIFIFTVCKNEIIKRLTEDNFKLVEPNTIGKVKSFTSES